VKLWEAPEGSREWRVPVVAVEHAIRAACARWRPRGRRRPLPLATLAGAAGRRGHRGQRVPASPARMGPATARFYAVIVDQLLSHDGSPAALARHVANGVLKLDSRGTRLAKEDKDSRRRIDVAVTAVMAHDRAAILAGDRGRASTSDELPGNEQTAPGSPDTEAVRYPLALSPVPK
jgi:hypothetical protein